MIDFWQGIIRIMAIIQKLDEFGRRHPWLVMAGVVALGFISAWLLIGQLQMQILLYEGF